MQIKKAIVRTQSLEAGQIFFPDHEEGLLLVAEGSLEVYVNIPIRRVFLAELPAGSLFTGALERPGAMVLMAVENSVLRFISPEEEQRYLSTLETRDKFAQLTDQWLGRLSEGVSKLAQRRPIAVTLSEGQRLILDKPTSLTSSHGHLWVRANADGSFMDITPAPKGSLQFLTPRSWLTLSDGEIRVSQSTSGIIGAIDWKWQVAAMTAVLVDTARTTAMNVRDNDLKRSEELEQKTGKDLSNARFRFQSILATKRVQQTIDTDAAYCFQRATGVKPTPQSLKEQDITFERFAAMNNARLRAIDLEKRWWVKDRGPMVAFQKVTNQPVVLKPGFFSGYRLHERGRLSRKVGRSLASTLKKEAYIVAPPLPNKELRVRDIILIGLVLCSMDMGTLAFATLAASLLGLVVPLATGFLIDTFIPGAMRQQTLLLGVALVVVQLCMAFMKLAGGFCRQRMDGRIAERVHGGVMDRLMRLPTSLTRSMGAVDLAMRVQAVDNVRKSIMDMVLNALMSGITGLTGVGVLLYYSPLAGAVAAGLIALMTVIAILLGSKQLKAFSEGEAMTASIYSLTQQIIENISVLRAFACERRAFTRWAVNSAEMRRRGLRARNVANLYEAFIATYQVAAVAVIFGILGFTMQGQEDITTGGYMVFVSTFQSFLAAGLTLSRGCNRLVTLQMSVKRAKPLLENTPETVPTAKDPGEISGAVEVSNVSFEHMPGMPVLKAISFRVSPGSFLGIVGPSGSGKSTLLSLLVGFEKAKGGAILYDGRDINGLDMAALRSQMGVVRQGGKLFAGTLLENILGANKGGQDEAWEAAKLAGIADDIRELPMGMHTMITEGASAFSGGQVQRLLLARALVGNPKMLLLDEATSALDNKTQAAISDNIDKIGATRIVVAHRLSSIQKADMILFLDQGVIKETGTYQDLVKKNGLFARFAERQDMAAAA